MITAATIREIAEAHLEGTPGFIVDVRISEGNHIRVLLDHDVATSIEHCMDLHRQLESSLDREAEDFSLDVSSPGLDQPLMLHRQYVKNIGRHVQVKPIVPPLATVGGSPLIGIVTPKAPVGVRQKTRWRSTTPGGISSVPSTAS